MRKNITLQIVLFSISFLFVSTKTFAQKDTLLLQECIKYVLKKNLNIQINENLKDISENNKSILNSGFLPKLTASTNGLEKIESAESSLTSGVTRNVTNGKSDFLTASLQLQYVIFEGGRSYYNFKKLKEQYNLTNVQTQEIIEKTILDAYVLYYQISKLQKNALTYDEIYSLSKERFLRAKEKHLFGQSTNLEILQAEVDMNNDSIQKITNLLNLATAKRDLNLIMGIDINKEYEVTWEDFTTTPKDKNMLLKNCLTRNLSLLQNKKNLDIAEKDISIQLAGYYPKIELSTSYNLGNSVFNQAVNPIVSTQTNSGWTFGVNFTWNLFDGGSREIRYLNAKKTKLNQELQLEQSKLNIQNSFENLWGKYTNALWTLEVQEKSLLTAVENFVRTREKYYSGLVTSIVFRQALINLSQAQIDYQDAQTNAKITEVQLLKISGKMGEIIPAIKNKEIQTEG